MSEPLENLHKFCQLAANLEGKLNFINVMEVGRVDFTAPVAVELIVSCSFRSRPFSMPVIGASVTVGESKKDAGRWNIGGRRRGKIPKISFFFLIIEVPERLPDLTSGGRDIFSLAHTQ